MSYQVLRRTLAVDRRLFWGSLQVMGIVLGAIGFFVGTALVGWVLVGDRVLTTHVRAHW